MMLVVSARTFTAHKMMYLKLNVNAKVQLNLKISVYIKMRIVLPLFIRNYHAR